MHAFCEKLQIEKKIELNKSTRMESERYNNREVHLTIREIHLVIGVEEFVVLCTYGLFPVNCDRPIVILYWYDLNKIKYNVGPIKKKLKQAKEKKRTRRLCDIRLLYTQAAELTKTLHDLADDQLQ